MSKKDQNGSRTETPGSVKRPPGLPVTTGHARPRPSLARHKIPAHFLTQLIAEHQRLAIQRNKRRVPTIFASNAYEAATARAVGHMPAGYGLTQTV